MCVPERIDCQRSKTHDKCAGKKQAVKGARDPMPKTDEMLDTQKNARTHMAANRFNEDRRLG